MPGPNKNFGNVKQDEIDGEVTNNNTISDLIGQGFEVSSNALQLLSSIWDGSNIVADVDNDSVTTEDIHITDADVTTDGTDPTNWISFTSDRGAPRQAVTTTQIAGDNSGVPIFDMDVTDKEIRSGLLIVTGADVNDTGKRFSELVTIVGFRLGTNFQTDTRGTPGGRTFSRDSSEINLAIDDAGETYNVQTHVIGARDLV